MTFWDKIKELIPKNINITAFNNIQIHLSDSNVMIGDQKIDDPELSRKILKKIKQYQKKESFPAQIIHKDLEQSYIDYENITTSFKDNLKKLKVVLPSEDIWCILMARRVKLSYDNNNSELAKKLQRRLASKYSDKGNKVYNLIGGGYFDEMIVPFIEIYKSEYEEKYIEEYRKFYNDIISFFPLAFFVGNHTNEKQIIEGIKERLKLVVPFIRLHAIGKTNIDKVSKVIENLDLKEYAIKDNRFTSPTGLKAQILEIKVKSSKISFSSDCE